jgi:ferredoxin-NADP reductase
MNDAVSPVRVSLPSRLWQPAIIAEITERTPRVKSFRLKPQKPFMFEAGQHAEVRLTAPDGYRAQRSYSISSSPEDM